MLVVGLSGGIASGKSAVAAQLSERLPLIDLDILAREVVEPGSAGLSKIVAHFGRSILTTDGALDRPKLGDIIFRDESQRKVLNGIVHPAIRRLMARRLIGFWLSGHKICVVDAPLLVEAGLWRFCGRILIVYCSERLQLERLMKRNSLSIDSAQARLDAQLPLSSKLVYADYVIENSGSLAELRAHVDSVIRRLDYDAGWTWRLSWLLPPWGLVSGVVTMLYRLYIKGVGQAKQRKPTKSQRSKL